MFAAFAARYRDACGHRSTRPGAVWLHTKRRRFAGYGAELAATNSKDCFYNLEAPVSVALRAGIRPIHTPSSGSIFRA